MVVYLDTKVGLRVEYSMPLLVQHSFLSALWLVIYFSWFYWSCNVWGENIKVPFFVLLCRVFSVIFYNCTITTKSNGKRKYWLKLCELVDLIWRVGVLLLPNVLFVNSVAPFAFFFCLFHHCIWIFIFIGRGGRAVVLFCPCARSHNHTRNVWYSHTVWHGSGQPHPEAASWHDLFARPPSCH